jgi:porphobilinogen synthase
MFTRPRRMRRTPALRASLAETHFEARHLIQPHFVHDHEKTHDIDAMPGIARMGIVSLVDRVGRDLELGITTVLLFGVHGDDQKDAQATEAVNPEGLIPQAVRALRSAFGQRLTIITDVCMCASTDHGHCGVLNESGYVSNDPSLPILAQMALVHAQAGADIVAPSDMMDGRVAAIRSRLDEEGRGETAILSYSTKFSSAFYGPFRAAADSAPGYGDRRSYQLDPRNRREALLESVLDEAEGADMLMVKPALSYLDIIQQVSENTSLPLVAYNVSGEYGMLKAAAEKGWLDEREAVLEVLTSIKRAGAQLIISYHAREALEKGWL